MWCSVPKILLGLLSIRAWIDGVEAFSWGGVEKRADTPRSLEEHMVNPSVVVHDASRLPNVYAVAMQELQELESEPLCHRIAARLLVNNCQLLEGKDDATVLTDSGRQIRDFVDSYAASLAICDLERGSFVIPSGCAPFREHALANLPTSKVAQLHVSPRQIDSCLSGLAKSDSAWNTWVSYRHKALRFCEAARADNDKAQSIRLYQRLTEVLSKLSEGVEQELEAHLHGINLRAAETTEQLRQMNPDIDQLRNSLQDLDRYVSQDVMQMVQASNSAMRGGLEDAQNLQQLLTVLLKTVLSSNAEVAASHELALTDFNERTGNEVAAVMAALATATASSTSLHGQLELSHIRAIELAHRQDSLEKGLEKLLDITDDISSKYESHSDKLSHVNQISEDLLDTLDNMASSTSEVRGSFHRPGWTSWVPYVACPAASLLMGSYGLPPSAVRNLGLIALGELAGFVVSYAKYLSPGILEADQYISPIIGAMNKTFISTASPNYLSRDLPLIQSNIRGSTTT
ncbi:nuclear membrane fusion protein Kar5 [Colletotrichum abscissum]|uniref:Nuclear membrane fusion protein Kar5 n=1 Tax=Colletotrichum abscissum TaxID=1671311 RepID=A0A9P9XG58_9PEZI|nr:nuclear membrane fusion protein Kar5 [Colletotrichum abscissum]KAI3553195.1 nuclear membrane fusion protein Kar5 [Colletotrichum abscissum]KAK1505857.1 nuclear membrane fusion protein Kar5 [Colletotrichum abscissum]